MCQFLVPKSASTPSISVPNTTKHMRPRNCTQKLYLVQISFSFLFGELFPLLYTTHSRCLVGPIMQLITLRLLMLNLTIVVKGACEAAQLYRHKTLLLSLYSLKIRNKLLLSYFLFGGWICDPSEYSTHLFSYFNFLLQCLGWPESHPMGQFQF